MNEQNPTPAALRAAQRLFLDEYGQRDQRYPTVERCAAIIDHETGLPELIREAEGALNAMIRNDFATIKLVPSLKAAIAKAKGK